MRNTYLKEVYNLAAKDRNVLSLVADNGMIVYDDFRRDFPEQYFNFGISEGHMITAAAGMASCGKIPFAYTIGAFLAYRSFEFIRLDVCLQKMNVKIVGIGAGMSYGYLGPTHHTTEDIAVLRTLPNLTLLSPASAKETKALVNYAYELNGPVYIRLGNNLKEELYPEDVQVIPGKGTVLKEGNDIVIFSTGDITYHVMTAAKRLEEEGIHATVISMHTIKPFDSQLVVDMAQRSTKLFTVEEHSIIGGLGSAVAEVLTDNGCSSGLKRIGLNDVFAHGYGNQEQVRKANGLDADGIYNSIKNNL
jgi:transketolase